MTNSTSYEWEWPHTKKWPKFSGERVDIIKKMFLAGEALNVNNFIKFYADTSQGFIDACEGLHHRILNIWEPEADTMICEMEVTYISHAGHVVTLPCCDIIKFEGDKVKELKIFMDINPLFQPPQA
jgi:hypothetical protein